ncbi:MAG: DUF2384 domain-containing protein [Gammaproteobacteria bacterium]|nr:DUF2384 domain-containing protein [Gammaproteobacteria bacterium]
MTVTAKNSKTKATEQNDGVLTPDLPITEEDDALEVMDAHLVKAKSESEFSIFSLELHIGKVLTGRSLKTINLIDMVRDGLPLVSVERVRKNMGIEHTESLLPYVGISSRTYARRKASKRGLTPIESDRLYRMAKIKSIAEDVFGDQATANSWLQSVNRALGAKPLELLDTEAGTDQVERVLTRIEHGVYS